MDASLVYLAICGALANAGLHPVELHAAVGVTETMPARASSIPEAVAGDQCHRQHLSGCLESWA